MKKIKKILFVLSVTIAITMLCYGLTTYKSSEPEHHYKLVFSDDFNGREINTASWNIIPRNNYGWGNYMSSNNRLYDVRNGRLRLYALVNNKIEPNDTAQYLTAGIDSKNHHWIKYGKVEIRARMVGSKGSWHALWLLGVDSVKHKTFPPESYAEIDIMEHYNKDRKGYHTVHSYYTIKQKQTLNPRNQGATKQYDYEKYNVYSVEILPDELVFRINDDISYRYPSMNSKTQYPFGKYNMYLMMDMQMIKGMQLTAIEKQNFVSYMDIDYVRFYELEN